MIEKTVNITVPDHIKHYDYRKWLLTALDQINAEQDQPNSTEVKVHTPSHFLEILGLKKIDKIMQSAINETHEDGSERYPNLQRVVISEGKEIPLDILLRK